MTDTPKTDADHFINGMKSIFPVQTVWLVVTTLRKQFDLKKKKDSKCCTQIKFFCVDQISGWVAVNNYNMQIVQAILKSFYLSEKRCATRENLRRSKQKKVVQYLGINEVVVVGCDRCWRRWWYKRVDAVVICLSLFVVAFFYDARKRKEDHAGMGWRVKSALALDH